jgi:hypothetical protein
MSATGWPHRSVPDDPDALFAEPLAELEDRLAVPYPDRALLLEELAADVSAAYGALRARGLGVEQARDEALRSLALDEETLRQLEDVHVPAVRRALGRLPPPVRQWLEILATALPLAALFVFLTMEVPLSEFLREGGEAIYFVLATGALGLFIEMQRLFIWFVLRDHSIAALRRNTPTPLYLAAATTLLGFLGTAIEYAAFLHRWAHRQIPLDRMADDVGQPLSCVITATSLATLIVLLHGALGVGLRAIRIPESKQRSD